MLALILQIAGFAGALIMLALGKPQWFAALFALHFAGDILYLIAQGLPDMASFLDKIDEYIKVKPWLQFVGLVGLAGTLFLSTASTVSKTVGFVAFGVSLAGFVYDLIYP